MFQQMEMAWGIGACAIIPEKILNIAKSGSFNSYEIYSLSDRIIVKILFRIVMINREACKRA
jgi:hypothetical protein